MAKTHSPSRLAGALRFVFKWGLALALLGALALGVAVFVAVQSLPSYRELSNRSDLGQMIRVRAADGSVLVSIGPSFGRWLTYDEIPQTMRTAMISVEDRRFRSHFGIDPIGLGRAVVNSVRTGKRVAATSTITQQLARNVFLTNNRSLGRKAKEGILAMALEARFSKDQILELYLNRVYFGGGAYGIDAAARTFYGHGADRLSLAEAAIIAGLVKAPSNYSPTADIEAARGRAQVVLDQMVANGFVSAAVARDTDPADVRLQPTPKQNSVRYFTDWALPQLDVLIDETNEPIEVWTTLDPAMQAAADRAINANVPKGAQGALVALDRDGAVRAMVGGKDYVSSIYNRATQAVRQPGSAWKLFVYLTALEGGMQPEDMVVDEPIDIQGWRPRNNSRTFAGSITLREAFARSINTVSAKIGAQYGFSTIASMARRFGINGTISTYPSMVLGSSEVRLLDMTRAFAAVGRGGISVTPYAIRKVVTADGRLLYSQDAPDQRVLVAPWVATQMTDLMQSAVMSGTGRAAQIGRPVAGKTGTTTSNKDGWFVGFSSGITTGVWMGRDDARAVAGLQGGTAPARAFHDFMVVAVAKRPVEAFPTIAPTPDWQLEPDEEAWNQPWDEPLVDADGNPLPGAMGEPADPLAPRSQPQPDDVDQQWLDEVLGRNRGPGPAPAPAPDDRGDPAPAAPTTRPPANRPPAEPSRPRPVSDPLQPRAPSPQ